MAASADLKEYGTVQRAMLGIAGASLGTSIMEDQQLSIKSGTLHFVIKQKEFGVVDGVWVREIVDGGSAGADIKVDDVIIGIDGKKVHNFADLQEAHHKHRPRVTKVTVKLILDKKEKNVEVTLKNEQELPK